MVYTPYAVRMGAVIEDDPLVVREIVIKTSSTGVGNASSGGTPASVGHSYAFGNTEEKARRLNMGCEARGQPSQPFSHKTGHGYVKAHRGFYHDAIFVKRNNFNLLLHETFGGGFSPTAVLKLRRLARKVARGSVDRTAYSPKYSLSFMSHHAERICLSLFECCARGVNRAICSHAWQPPCLHVSRASEQGVTCPNAV